MNVKNDTTFHLGLTMGGAVSAGCYTAGVMDYIFEVLDLWEKAKKDNPLNLDEKLIAPHDVIIDVMGGASAGGIATIMSALYVLTKEIKPVKTPPKDPLEKHNILYDSWVHLDDKKGEKKTFEKIWGLSDLVGKKPKIHSLFDTAPIESISDKAFEIPVDFDLKERVNKMPAYISKDLEVLLSHALLHGIPLEVSFATSDETTKSKAPTHTSYEHYLVSHFKLNYGNPIDENKYLWLNPFDEKSKKQMQLSTISTGAFPVGLKYRKFNQEQFNDEYIKTVVSRMLEGNFGLENPPIKDKINWTKHLNNFTSVGIDGGTINNEPYGEVASILEHKFGSKNESSNDTFVSGENSKEKSYQRFGLIMIDPFPDVVRDIDEYEAPNDLLSVIPKIIGTLMDQSKVKRREMLKQHSDNDYFRGEIFPSRNHYNEQGEKVGSENYPIASATFQAFGGFLDVDFRTHDFFLGRNNARNFLRYFCSLPYDPENGIINPIHKNWSKECVQKFIVYREGKPFLPIIPDINLVINNLNPSSEYKNYTVPERPKYDAENILRLKNIIKRRFEKIVEISGKNAIESISDKNLDEKKQTPLTDQWLNKKNKPLFESIKQKIKTRLGKMTLNMTKKALAKELSKKTIEMILKDLEVKGFLKEKE